MHRIDNQSYATIVFTLRWSSERAQHEERFLARKINLWRDMLPPGFGDLLTGLAAGEAVSRTYQPGEALPLHNPGLLFRLPVQAFRQPRPAARRVQLRQGRHYPRGLFEGLPGVFPQDARPARIHSINEEGLTLDCNHPLAGRAFTLEAHVQEVLPKRSDTGGRLTCWLEEICDYGPGMQAQPCVVDFGGPEASHRLDNAEDSRFYAAPRMVGHIDAQASETLTALHMERIQPGSTVLDLMSSIQSHLPSGQGLRVTGLGLNPVELAANPRLENFHTQDLNARPALPFLDGSFDAVTLSLSVEYLLDPAAVLAECHRVLRPGGALCVGFSDRWFPTKATALWMDLHEFEREGFVLSLLGRGWTDLRTASARNWWRPKDDPHVSQTWTSDPVHLVSACKARGAEE